LLNHYPEECIPSRHLSKRATRRGATTRTLPFLYFRMNATTCPPPSHAARAFAENRHAATSRRTCS